MKRCAAYKVSLCLLSLVFILQGLYFGAIGEAAAMSIGASVATGGVAVTENYTLRLTAADATCPMPGDKKGGTYDLTFTGAGSKTFPAISFGTPGNYRYTISQVAGSHALAVSYDKGIYDLRVTVQQVGGKTQLTAVMNRQGSDKKAASADFSNVYVSPAVVEHNPPVSKVVKGDKPATAATFRFTFRAVSNTAGIGTMPMPEGSVNGVKTVSTTPGVSKEFGTMTFTAPGKYIYQIAEVNDSQTGYTYFPRYKDYDVYNTKLPPETDEDNFDGFVNLLESNLNLGALSEQELEDLMSLFGYKTPSAGLLPTGDEIPWWPIAFGSAGLLALVALLILERKRRA